MAARSELLVDRPGDDRADVVVVGAGTAGCLVAARFSADPRCRVVLVDIGPDVAASGEALPTRSGNLFDAMLGTPDRVGALDVSLRHDSARSPYLAGVGLGGSSAINGMVATWGQPDDYDAWAANGCAGWNDVTLRAALARADVPQRSVPVSARGRLTNALIDSSAVLPVDVVQSADGQRVTVAESYLDPARRARPNLSVITDRKVDTVLFDGRRAVGVACADGTAIGADNVVVCAGAIHTPTILLRSGVQRDGLGRNLHDHPAADIVLARRTPNDASFGAPQCAASAVGWRRWRNDHDALLMPVDLGPGGHGADIVLALAMATRSRGTVTLDQTGEPVVDFNLLDDDHDVELLSFARQQAFAALDASPTIAAHWDVDQSSGAQLSTRVFHAAGTCRMGSADDSSAVVDEALAVVGCSRLWVCDASVIPSLPRATPYLTVLAIAETFAARWLAGWPPS